jgi:carnitine-CoA ligase
VQAPIEPVPIPRLLERRAADLGSRDFIRFEGRSITYAAALDRVARAAAGYAALGVRRGQLVAVMLGNRPEWLEAWWGLGWLGAVEVPVNPAYRGTPLVNQLNDCGAELMVVEAGLLANVAEVAPGLRSLRRLVVAGEPPEGLDVPFELLSWEELENRPPVGAAAVESWDLAAVMYTSGTTGVSKGVLCPWGHVYSNSNSPAQAELLADGQVLQLCLPMCHIGGQWFGLAGCLIAGATLSLAPRFSASSFWGEARAAGAGCALLVGAMASFLLKQPPRPNDREHGLRRILCTPAPARFEEFERRFGVTLSVSYGLTEGSTPIGDPLPDHPRMCGRARGAEFELLVADGHDQAVPDGEAGELLLRPRLPWTVMTGYLNRPEESLRAWRNGWLHTGDLVTRDRDGRYFFLDRLDDSIRRRGENISAAELEAEACSHPLVEEAAAVAVPSEDGEDEVKLSYRVSAGAELSPAELAVHLAQTLPDFMVPRFLERVEELPRTDTHKVRKQELRVAGVGAAWDREASRLRSP